MNKPKVNKHSNIKTRLIDMLIGLVAGSQNPDIVTISRVQRELQILTNHTLSDMILLIRLSKEEIQA